ncbi:MAG: type II toxin-antitoxin system PemK/MazF family toxin [Saprospiraceae bacterium]|nr:type II toxin-antitoxin system PemK/MazF family toxin [Saprospiraceae bacterium]
MVVKRFEIWLVSLDPVQGSEISKTRPCVIVSPDVLNRHLATVLAAPLTSTIKNYPSRLNFTFADKNGQIALDQIRAVDKTRLVKNLGMLDGTTAFQLCALLTEMFEY